MKRHNLSPRLGWAVSLLVLVGAPHLLRGQQRLPKTDVIDVPAIGDGLCLHNLFQSNMVLQQNRPIRIWGWAAPNEQVTVSLGADRREARAAADRRWEVSLPARPANPSPVSMTVSGASRTVTLENILIGDVWLLGGQSNMEFPLERVDSGKLEIVSANFENVRVLTVPAQQGPEVRLGFPRLQEWSGWFGRHFRKGDWDVCSPAIARELSAIGYVFARRIHMATRIPIGVIDVSRGGTTVETWTPDAVLREIGTPEVTGLLADWDQRVASWDAAEDLAKRKRSFENRVRNKQTRGEPIPPNWEAPKDLRPGPARDQNRPGNCYNSMLAPIAGLAVKGAIFHQGFNNANGGTAGANLYYQVFGRMIEAWRAAFGDPEMPFGIISLCTAGPQQDRANYVEMMFNDGIYIREAQYRTFVDLRTAGDENIGFASSFDQRRGWYHPQLKIPVGERIARWALATQYGLGKQIRWLPPTCTEMETVDGKLILRMDGVVSAADNQAAMVGFAIAGKDRRFQPAKVEWGTKGVDGRGRPQVDRKVLVLTSAHVAVPIHYRYAWGRNPMANVQAADHTEIPFATQRSDRWPMEDVPLGVLGGEPVVGKLSRQQQRKIRQALRKEDLERRLAEAKALLRQHGQVSTKK